jgi:plastocyanin
MRLPAVAIATLFVGFLAVSCSGGSTNESDGSSPASTATSTTAPAGTMTIQSSSYGPELIVAPGVIVSVRNADEVAHNVVAEDGSFRSADLAPGEAGTFTAPERPGRYVFVCTLQPRMRGTILVSETPPTGGLPSSGRPSAPGSSVPGGPSAPGSTPPPGGY